MTTVFETVEERNYSAFLKVRFAAAISFERGSHLENGQENSSAASDQLRQLADCFQCELLIETIAVTYQLSICDSLQVIQF